MPKLHPVKPREIISILEKLGFLLIRQSGSHAIFRHLDGRWTTVPIHPVKNVAKGTLRKILKDIGITTEEFEKIL